MRLSHSLGLRASGAGFLNVISAACCAGICALAALPAPAQCSYSWHSGLPLVNGQVYATAVFDDGQGDGPVVYMAGDLSALGGLNSLARWDGHNLTFVGGDIGHFGGWYTEVHALTVFNGALIVAGDFTTVGGLSTPNIARWDGTRWSALGEGLDQLVYALTTYQGSLIAGGDFSDNLRRWNGTAWVGMNSLIGGAVRSLGVYNNKLVVGGEFVSFITSPVSRYLVQFDGTTWSPLGAPNGYVYSLGTFNNELIVGGWFSQIGGISAANIARWNGSTWSPLGGGAGGIVKSLALYEGQLAVGGNFGGVGGVGGITAGLIARWDGANWSGFSSGLTFSDADSEAKSISVVGDQLTAGGNFHFAGGHPSRYWAVWGPSEGGGDMCDDGLFCNGLETCVDGACAAGPSPCAAPQRCRENDDRCVACLSNADCSDGLFCNGLETCTAAGTCQAGATPCAGQTCVESNDTCIANSEVWISFIDAAVVPGVGTVGPEDVVAFNLAAGTWSMIFDGSDVDLSGFVIDGLARMADGSLLLSFTAAGNVPGLTGGPSATSADDSDIVRFIASSLGANTAGSFVFYFDGSDVGLTTDDEDIDGIAVLPTGQLLLSFLGAVSATGASGADTDLLQFNATALGSVTTGSFAIYFDGSDVSLTDNGAEDVDAVALSGSTLLLSTLGNFSVPGVSGADEDVLRFTPTRLGATTSGIHAMFLDLSAKGIATAENIGALEFKE